LYRQASAVVIVHEGLLVLGKIGGLVWGIVDGMGCMEPCARESSESTDPSSGMEWMGNADFAIFELVFLR